MSGEEFDKEFDKFLSAFDQAFDTPENRASIQQVVVNNSENEEDIALNYEHVYQEQRTNNLIKAAIANFVVDDKA